MRINIVQIISIVVLVLLNALGAAIQFLPIEPGFLAICLLLQLGFDALYLLWFSWEFPRREV